MNTKYAVLFPGQGSQFIGMGKELAQNFAIAKQTFEEVDDIRLEPILASVLLLKARDEFECDRVYSVCEKYLLFKPLEKRKERFRGLTKYAFNEKEREDLKWYLTELYFSDLNIFQKLLTVSPKELFV